LEANQTPLLQIARASKSGGTAIGNLMSLLGQEYRGGRAHQIPWDQIAAGLREGTDPAAAIEKARAAEALAAINLQGLDAKTTNASGLEMLKKNLDDIQGVLSVM